VCNSDFSRLHLQAQPNPHSFKLDITSCYKKSAHVSERWCEDSGGLYTVCYVNYTIFPEKSQPFVTRHEVSK